MEKAKHISPLAKTAKHWDFLDVLKGLLIVLVFVGHLIPGSREEVLPRFLIYSFHMPLFIGISGFLFNIEKYSFTVKSFVIKYGKRMLLPWFIAVVVYFFFNRVYLNPKPLTFAKFLKYLYSPYYHLWYIVGALGYIIASLLLWKTVKRFKCRWAVMLAVSAVISAISHYSVLLDPIKEAAKAGKIAPVIPAALNTLKIDFKPFIFFMFVFGMFLRNLYEHGRLTKIKRLAPYMLVLFFVLLGVDLCAYYSTNSALQDTVYFLMSIPLLSLFVSITLSGRQVRSTVLEFIGRYSLPIYLYHVICISIAKKVYGLGTQEYYIVSIALFAVLCLLVYVLRRVPFINKVIFGSTNSALQKK